MKTNEALDGLAYLRTYGWAKASFGESGVDGPACLQGLWTRKRVISKSTFRLIEEIIQEQYPERWSGTVLGFNDHHATVFEDVEKVLEKTAARLDEDVFET